MYYGQSMPPVDWLIEKFFPLGFVGSCVEVGAVDGKYLSNTLHFEEMGWQCLCIEPNSHYHDALRQNRKLMLPYAVSDSNQDGLTLHRVQIGTSFDCGTALKLDLKLMAKHAQTITFQDEILVSARTLDACLEEVHWKTAIDFVSIDTEGTELSALKGFSLDRWKPKLLVIENNHDTSDVAEYLRPREYQKVIRYEANDFYVRVL
jgi:FkbM family methyltransferase